MSLKVIGSVIFVRLLTVGHSQCAANPKSAVYPAYCHHYHCDVLQHEQAAFQLVLCETHY